MNGKIYVAFNTRSGKTYVGQTSQSLEERQKRHLGNRNRLRTPFACALRKDASRFVWTVLIENLSEQKDLDDAEIYWGTHFDALAPQGYNLRLGSGRVLWSLEERARMSTFQKYNQSRPDVRERKIISLRIAHNRPDVKEHNRETQRMIQKRVQGSDEMRARKRANASNPVTRARAALTNSLPEVKERRSLAAKRMWERRRSRQKQES